MGKVVQNSVSILTGMVAWSSLTMNIMPASLPLNLLLQAGEEANERYARSITLKIVVSAITACALMG